jgi:hypothetical protein
MSRPKIRKKNPSKKKNALKEAEKALQRRSGLFLNMPDKCCVCEGAFDKKSKEMALTWRVVVFEERQTVRLTCPTCWEGVEKMMEEETNAG